MNAEILSFDCYGTLIDWKQGVLDALVPLFDEFLIDISGEEIFTLFLKLDAQLESVKYRSYKEILKEIMKGFSSELGLNLLDEDLLILTKTIAKWPVFPDTIESLRKLKSIYKLAVISNIDNDLFQETNDTLGIEFDFVITSEDLKSYKPSAKNFDEALKTFHVPKAKHLHCAQSIYHDIIPCNQLEINNYWLNRYNEMLPDATFNRHVKELRGLKDLVAVLGL